MTRQCLPNEHASLSSNPQRAYESMCLGRNTCNTRALTQRWQRKRESMGNLMDTSLQYRAETNRETLPLTRWKMRTKSSMTLHSRLYMHLLECGEKNETDYKSH